jgi:hypothetical protein
MSLYRFCRLLQLGQELRLLLVGCYRPEWLALGRHFELVMVDERHVTTSPVDRLLRSDRNVYFTTRCGRRYRIEPTGIDAAQPHCRLECVDTLFRAATILRVRHGASGAADASRLEGWALEFLQTHP